MKKFLVPIDFSDASVNAAQYAAGLTAGLPDSEIILYHVYSKISFSPFSEKDEKTRAAISEEELKVLADKLDIDPNTSVSVVAEEGSLADNIEKFALGNHVDMIIMGITGSSRLRQVFMGTNTLNVVRHVKVPVMIIPPDAKFTEIKKVLFTSDFKDVARTTPFAGLKDLLDTFKPKLQILNVDSEHYIELTDEYKIERESMEDKLGKYEPEFSFLRAYDFLEGINRFAESKDVDAIITVPHKHSFLSQLFKTTHTKKLAYHSHVPIIAIH